MKKDIRETVRRGYGEIALSGGSCCGPAKSCCGTGDAGGVAKIVGYSDAELATLPEGANMGLSCGNPTALAGLWPGETVLDLGAGGGFDVFLVALKVGAAGHAIGVDMTPEVDVVISNCVINLSPDKSQVWREVFRVLKPGGRVAVSDLALLRPLPDAVQKTAEALVGCVAGAVLVGDTEAMMRAAGFVDLALESKPEYIESMSQWNDPLYRGIIEKLPAGERLADYVTSFSIAARKPGA